MTTTDAVAEVTAAFAAYEQALVADDLDALDTWFWPDATRYGTDGNQYDGAEIDAARRRPHPSLDRRLERTRIRAAAPDVVVAETEFVRTGGAIGRQSQVWVRRAGRWAILHAHVSMHP